MQVKPDSIMDMAKAIQLALAPVFLLTGVAGILNVMAGRLSRIVDRGRYLLETQALGTQLTDHNLVELQNLERRRHYVSVAITACTIAALLLCMVIVSLFVEAMFVVSLKWLVGVIFTTSTLALTVGLAFFLREVHLATRTVRINPSKMNRD